LAKGEPACAARLDREPAQGIVVVVIDALRADHLSCYGFQRPTPNIDAMAGKGVVFEKAYANGSWTKPAIASLFTGLWPSETGTTALTAKAVDGTYRETGIPGGIETLAEALGKKGYQCAGFVSNPNLSAEVGFARGFAVYDERQGRCKELAARCARWFTSLPEGRRFFAYLHFLEPHAPYAVADPLPGKMDGTAATPSIIVPAGVRSYQDFAEWRDAVNLGKRSVSREELEVILSTYDAKIRECDTAIGDLVRALQDAGVFENALVIITADHGENFLEHGTIEHPAWGLYEEQLSIPLVVKFPVSWGVGHRRVKGTAQTIDIPATICGAAGEAFGRGVDLAGYAASGRLPDRMIVCESSSGFMVMGNGTKAQFRNSGDAANIVGLYDVRKGRPQGDNILEKWPSYVSRLTKRVARWKEFVAARRPGNAGMTAGAISEKRREELRAVGYLN